MIVLLTTPPVNFTRTGQGRKLTTFLSRAKNAEHIAAIDLGSNAMRAIIVKKTSTGLEVVKNIREPLRLGEDVFAKGKISQEKMLLTEEAFISLLHLFTEYNVKNIRSMATSAMRDAKNGKELKRRILELTGIEIETISGHDEAEIICDAVRYQVPLKKKTAVLMDIGGGSTELTILVDEKIIASQSFNIGTVRLLRYHTAQDLDLRINLQLQKMVRYLKGHINLKKIDIFIGTGGNLRRIGKIRKKLLGHGSTEFCSFEEIDHMTETIRRMSFVERVRGLELDQNRADVILPAIMITHHLMRKLEMEKIILPKVGLKEGIILSMLETKPKKFKLKD